MAGAAVRRIFPQDEGEPELYECDLVDGTTPVPGSALTTLTLTYYVGDQPDLDTPESRIVGGHNGTENLLLPGSPVTVDSNGHLRWQQVAADAEIKNPKCGTELHLGRWDFTYTSGPSTKPGSHEFGYRVKNLRRKG